MEAPPRSLTQRQRTLLEEACRTRARVRAATSILTQVAPPQPLQKRLRGKQPQPAPPAEASERDCRETQRGQSYLRRSSRARRRPSRPLAAAALRSANERPGDHAGPGREPGLEPAPCPPFGHGHVRERFHMNSSKERPLPGPARKSRCWSSGSKISLSQLRWPIFCVLPILYICAKTC